jgi:hypothetical protein
LGTGNTINLAAAAGVSLTVGGAWNILVDFGTVIGETTAGGLEAFDSARLLRGATGLLSFALFAKLPVPTGAVPAVSAGEAAIAQGASKVSVTPAAAEDGSNIVYRAITAADAEALAAGRGLTAKAPQGTWTAAEHVANSGPGVGGAAANSPWISTTRSLDLARAYDGGLGIVRIDLSKVTSFQAEVWRTAPRLNGVQGLPYHRSIWAQEVTIFQEIPASAILGPVR